MCYNFCKDCDNIGYNLVLLGALVAITLAKDLSLSEQDLLGNFLQVIAQNLLSMSSAVSDCETICSNNNSSSNNTGTGPGQNDNNNSSNTNTYSTKT